MKSSLVLSSIFAHPRSHDKQLLCIGMLAERNFSDGPTTCLLKLRQLTELLRRERTEIERRRGKRISPNFIYATLPRKVGEIVRRVKDLFAFADRIQTWLSNTRRTVERLTPATLAKAFRGELVSQDPNDEPAGVLLKRLKSAEPTPSAAKTRRKRSSAV